MVWHGFVKFGQCCKSSICIYMLRSQAKGETKLRWDAVMEGGWNEMGWDRMGWVPLLSSYFGLIFLCINLSICARLSVYSIHLKLFRARPSHHFTYLHMDPTRRSTPHMRCSMFTLLLFLVGEMGIGMDGAQNPNPLSYRVVVCFDRIHPHL